jgi:hypothetical protein
LMRSSRRRPWMPTSGLTPGDVIHYPYRWAREAQRRRSAEGSKVRPCGVVVAVAAASGRTHILLAAISSKPPMADQATIAIPEIERRRAGLDANREAWIYVSEANEDVEGVSLYLTGDPRLGTFSRAFVERVKAAFLAELVRRPGARINRT